MSDPRSGHLSDDIAIEALQALYDRHTGALGTTAGVMMTGREAEASYRKAMDAREALASYGVEVRDPAEDGWIAQILRRAKDAFVNGTYDVHPRIGPALSTEP